MDQDNMMRWGDTSDYGLEQIAKVLTEALCQSPNDIPVTKDIVRVALAGMPEYFSYDEYNKFVDRVEKELIGREIFRMVDKGLLELGVDTNGEMITTLTPIGVKVAKALKTKPG